jgi:hypothetical protein
MVETGLLGTEYYGGLIKGISRSQMTRLLLVNSISFRCFSCIALENLFGDS